MNLDIQSDRREQKALVYYFIRCTSTIINIQWAIICMARCTLHCGKYNELGFSIFFFWFFEKHISGENKQSQCIDCMVGVLCVSMDAASKRSTFARVVYILFFSLLPLKMCKLWWRATRFKHQTLFVCKFTQNKPLSVGVVCAIESLLGDQERGYTTCSVCSVMDEYLVSTYTTACWAAIFDSRLWCSVNIKYGK